jgi:hypothetical protein
MVTISIGLLAGALSVSGSAGGSIELLLTGQFHGDEVSARSGERWFGVFPKKDGFELAEAVIKVSLIEDPIVDEEGKKTGKVVSTDKKEKPLFLVKGVSGLKPGRVHTVFTGNLFLEPGQHLALNLNDQDQYHFNASAGRKTPDGSNRDYKIELRLGEKTQTIVSMEGTDIDGPPLLLWAGDLDRDGKLDLLMDLTNHYNMEMYTLFLSSKAGKGRLLEEVAHFVTVGC